MDLATNRVGLGTHPALILVDMIEGFTNPACPLGCHCPEVVSANRELLEAFRLAKLPVFFTTVVYHDETQARVFRDKLPALNVLSPDSPWVKIDAALSPLNDEKIIEKQWASSFFGTNLAELLKNENVDSLIITGLTTSGCVRATVVDGLQHNYPVVVAQEAVGDRNVDAHKANLFDMQAKYAELWTNVQLINYVQALV